MGKRNKDRRIFSRFTRDTRTKQATSCNGSHFSTRRVAQRYTRTVRRKDQIFDPVKCKGGHWHLQGRGATEPGMAAARAARAAR